MDPRPGLLLYWHIYMLPFVLEHNETQVTLCVIFSQEYNKDQKQIIIILYEQYTFNGFSMNSILTIRVD